MDATTILTEARTALGIETGRVAALVRSLPHSEFPIPESEWTVREAAAHIVSFAPVYVDIARGAPSPLTTMAPALHAIESRQRIADIPETDPGKLADLLMDGARLVLEATAGRAGDQPVTFHCGIEMNLAGLVGVVLGEALLHGYDMSRGVGQPWPIDRAHAELVLYGYGPLFPHFVNPDTAQGLDVAYDVELRGSVRFTVRFTDGHCRIEAGESGPVDCNISADPVAFLLAGSGRLSRWTAIALGLLEAGGARPELALCFGDLFVYP